MRRFLYVCLSVTWPKFRLVRPILLVPMVQCIRYNAFYNLFNKQVGSLQRQVAFFFSRKSGKNLASLWRETQNQFGAALCKVKKCYELDAWVSSTKCISFVSPYKGKVKEKYRVWFTKNDTPLLCSDLVDYPIALLLRRNKLHRIVWVLEELYTKYSPRQLKSMSPRSHILRSLYSRPTLITLHTLAQITFFLRAQCFVNWTIYIQCEALSLVHCGAII